MGLYRLIRAGVVWLAVCAGLAACQEYSLDVSFEIPEEFLQDSLLDLCQPRCDQVENDCLHPDTSTCELFLESCLEECVEGDCQESCHRQYDGCLEPDVDEDMCSLLRIDCLEECQDEQVVRAVLQIFLPPASSPFGCDDLAYGLVTDDLLSASLIADVELDLTREKGISLPGIDRKPRKVLLAQGLDTTGQPAVVSCQEIGEIRGAEHVRLQAEPAAVVRFERAYQEPGPYTRIGPLPQTVTILVTDVFGRELTGQEVIWTLLEPGGISQSVQDATDDQGQAEYQPALPEAPGPRLLEAQVRWPREIPPFVRGFEMPQALGIRVDNYAELCRQGRIGPAGRAGVVCLGHEISGTSSTCLTQIGYDPDAGQGQGTLFSNRTCVPESMSRVALGLVPDDDSDRVVMVSEDQLYRFDPDGSYTTLAFLPPAGQTQPMGIFPVGSCTGADERLPILVRFESQTAVCSALDATVISHVFSSLPNPIRVYASGCVSDQTGTSHRLLVVSYGTGSDSFLGAVANMGGGLVHIPIPGLPLEPLEFVPPRGEQPGHLLTLRHQNDRPEAAVCEIHYRAGLAESRLDVVDSYPLFASPLALSSGDLDGDALFDVVARIPTGDGGFSQIQQVLGFSHRDRPMYGFTPVGAGLERVYYLWSADFDGDGLDDIATYGRETCEPWPQCLESCDLAWKECMAGSGTNPTCDDEREACVSACPTDYCPHSLYVSFMGRLYPGD